MKSGVVIGLLLFLAFPGTALSQAKKPASSQNTPSEKPSPKAPDDTHDASTSTGAAAAEEGRRPSLNAAVVLKVVNPDEAKTAIKGEAERLKGFMSYLDGRSIVLKVPPHRLPEIMAFTAKQGYVIEKTLGREELSAEIAELEGRLKSKVEILERLRGFFNDSDAIATLEIEQTMTSLVMEIEQVKGRLRLLTDRADWAVLNVSFSFRERDRVVYVESDFEWLNFADLDQFIRRFEEVE